MLSDYEYLLLQRFYNGESISHVEFDEELRGLSLSQMKFKSDAFNSFINEKYVKPVTPYPNANTKFVIDDAGIILYDMEKAQRDEINNQQIEKMRIDGLQVQLLELSIKTANSTKDTNQSFQNLNDEVLPKNFKVQERIGNRTLIILGIYTLATIAQLYVTVSSRDRQSLPQLQEQSRSLETLKRSLQMIDTSLRKFVDLYAKDTLPHGKDSNKIKHH